MCVCESAGSTMGEENNPEVNGVCARRCGVEGLRENGWLAAWLAAWLG